MQTDFNYIGNKDLMNKNPICLFCSRSIELSLYYSAREFTNLIMQQNLTLAGGWHSTLEKKALRVRKPSSPSNIIYFLAKGLKDFQIPDYLEYDLDNCRLLIISKWDRNPRIDQRKVDIRNKVKLSFLSCNFKFEYYPY